jgi:hypothetical protein
VEMEFKRYRATRKNLELLRKVLNELGYNKYENYSTDEAYPVEHDINNLDLECFKIECWHSIYTLEINYRMQELEKEL